MVAPVDLREPGHGWLLSLALLGTGPLSHKTSAAAGEFTLSVRIYLAELDRSVSGQEFGFLETDHSDGTTTFRCREEYDTGRVAQCRVCMYVRVWGVS